MGIAIVLLIRLTVPFLILKKPFWGAVLAILADACDLTILNHFGWPYSYGIQYQSLDKVLDTYYLAFELVVALRLSNPLIRKTLSGLFIWRVIGVVLFEITHVRQILFFAPNVFEYVYLIIYGTKKYAPSFQIDTSQKLLFVVLLVTAPQLVQEYIHHYREYPLGLGSASRFIWYVILKQ